jgi:hypothetical protein
VIKLFCPLSDLKWNHEVKIRQVSLATYAVDIRGWRGAQDGFSSEGVPIGEGAGDVPTSLWLLLHPADVPEPSVLEGLHAGTFSGEHAPLSGEASAPHLL